MTTHVDELIQRGRGQGHLSLPELRAAFERLSPASRYRRFFGGLTAEETVEAISASGTEVSLRTVERDWRFSRAWLQNEFGAS